MRWGRVCASAADQRTRERLWQADRRAVDWTPSVELFLICGRRKNFCEFFAATARSETIFCQRGKISGNELARLGDS